MESVLSIESIWEDEHMLEVRVFASNSRFSATTDFYTTRGELSELAKSLKDFPNTDERVKFWQDEGADISPCSLEFKSSNDHNGHISLRTKIVHFATNSNLVKEQADFEIIIEPYALDTFVNELLSLTKCKVGEIKAELIGI